MGQIQKEVTKAIKNGETAERAVLNAVKSHKLSMSQMELLYIAVTSVRGN